jgi:hypothetical protein
MVKGILDGEVENNYKPIPEGLYFGRVTAIAMKTSKAGNDYLNIEFTLESKRKMWDKLMWHNEACVNVMKGKMESLGFTREERKQLDPDDHQSLTSAVNAMVQGKKYEIKIGFDKDGQNVIKYFNDTSEASAGAEFNPFG